MKQLTILLTLIVAIFYNDQTWARRFNPIKDTSELRCRNEASRQAAIEVLRRRNVRPRWRWRLFRDIGDEFNKSCDKYYPQQRPPILPASTVSKAKSGAGPDDSVQGRRTQLAKELIMSSTRENGVASCLNTEYLEYLANQYEFSYGEALDICNSQKNAILRGLVTTPDQGVQQEALFGNIIRDILDAITIDRKVYISDLRIRFSSAIILNKLNNPRLTPMGLLYRREPWMCIDNYVFGSVGPRTHNLNSFRPLSFNIIYDRINDSDLFEYGSYNGYEMTGGPR